ncbi:phosphomevalonate kinase [Nocardia tenerifensis]|uniref:Phosphomevalonate kinase n=1 Tax=Nocardia tenerifensis TaxID=228006 RepID=A0A318KBU7_9NOCA|nr:phosphomevalonate kinase [Nocardia tenerifensis]PXX71788.1 phosphomevalonate kinase [Nocardia tenerifensis]
MITCRAPGKLFIAGEYAVVQPGHRAVLAAIDRYATATVRAAEGDTTLRSELDGGGTLSCRRDGDRLVPSTVDSRVPEAFAYVFAAAEVIDRLIVERGAPARPFHLTISTDLGDTDGRKFGLGASAAVTVATVDALGQFHRLDLSAMDRYQLAMLATISINPRASGGDIAASTWGGWLAYRSPDREHVAEHRGVDAALHAPWPGLSVRPLPTPTGLAMQVGWTGVPASTPKLVAGLGDRRRDRSAFLSDSDQCVERLVDALEADDSLAIQLEIRRARALLTELDATDRLGIMTPRLQALCDAGEAVGAAAKPSGAGGGDCGIALIERTRAAAITELTDRWVSAGIRPLPLRIHPCEGARA